MDPESDPNALSEWLRAELSRAYGNRAPSRDLLAAAMLAIEHRHSSSGSRPIWWPRVARGSMLRRAAIGAMAFLFFALLVSWPLVQLPVQHLQGRSPLTTASPSPRDSVPPAYGQMHPACPAMMSFVDQQHGWADIGAGIYATTNGGRSWLPRSPSKNSLYPSVDFVNTEDGWVARQNSSSISIWRTTDGGLTWSALRLPSGAKWLWCATFISPSTGYLVTGTTWPFGPDGRHQLYRTSDGGERWLPVSTPLQPEVVCFSGPTYGWVAGLSPHGKKIVIYKTGDGGRSWHLSFYRARPQLIVAATMNACDGQSDLVVLTGMSGGMHQLPEMEVSTSDGGTSWRVNTNSSAPTAIEQVGTQMTYYAATSPVTGSSILFYESADGGKSFSYHPLPPPVGYWSNGPDGMSFIDRSVGWISAALLPQISNTSTTGFSARSGRVILTGGPPCAEGIFSTGNGGQSWHLLTVVSRPGAESVCRSIVAS